MATPSPSSGTLPSVGCDMHGAVEIRQPGGWWEYLVDLCPIIGRDYDLFGCLFGVRNDAGFRPAAPARGLPEDVTERTRADFEDWDADAHSPTWIAWDEVVALDPDQPAARADSSPHRYRRDPDGTEHDLGGSGVDAAFRAAGGPWLTPDGERWPPGTEFPGPGDTFFRFEPLRRGETLSRADGWDLVCRLVKALEPDYPADRVRLVVWFDN